MTTVSPDAVLHVHQLTAEEARRVRALSPPDQLCGRHTLAFPHDGAALSKFRPALPDDYQQRVMRALEAISLTPVYALRVSQLRSINRAVGEAMMQQELSSAAWAVTPRLLCDLESEFVSTGLIDPADTLSSNLRDAIHLAAARRDLPGSVAEAEMQHKLMKIRSRWDKRRWNTMHNVRTVLSVSGLHSALDNLERGLVGPFRREDLSNVSALRRRHRHLLDMPEKCVPSETSLLFALSYRHKEEAKRTYHKDRMRDANYRDLLQFLRMVAGNGEDAYFWQDQKAKGKLSDNDLDWVGVGLVPYMVVPTLSLVSDIDLDDNDIHRTWIACERMCAGLSCGLISVDQCIVRDNVPFRGAPITEVLYRVAANILGGCLSGKSAGWKNDNIRIHKWAAEIMRCTLWADCVTVMNRTLNRTNLTEKMPLSRDDMLTILWKTVDYGSKGLDTSCVLTGTLQGKCHAAWTDFLPTISTEANSQDGTFIFTTAELSDIAKEICYEIVKDGEDLYYVILPEVFTGHDEVVIGKLCGDNSNGYHIVATLRSSCPGVKRGLELVALESIASAVSGNPLEAAKTYVDGKICQQRLAEDIVSWWTGKNVEHVGYQSGETFKCKSCRSS